MATHNQYDMQDPTKQYPQPDFDKQPQSAPGLAQEMDPKPDHGEQSYKGFGRLHGRKALITGANSGIGRAVAIAFAREGADIALSYLPSEERTPPRSSPWCGKPAARQRHCRATSATRRSR